MYYMISATYKGDDVFGAVKRTILREPLMFLTMCLHGPVPFLG